MVLTPVARSLRLVVMSGLAVCVLSADASAQAPDAPKPASETPAVPGTPTQAQQVRIAYLGVRRMEPAIYDDESLPADSGIAGAKIAMRDMKTTGRLTGQDFQLDDHLLGRGESPVEAAKALVAKGEGLIIADLPAKDLLDVSDALKGTPAQLFNIQAEDDRLRQGDCRENVTHVVPSRSMLTDALMQFLFMKQWRKVFLITGKDADDTLYADAVRRSVKKFGMKLVGDKPWTFGNLARERADGPTQADALVFTRGTSADVIVVADEAGNFGDYIQYHTSEPKLVTGTQGLVPATWSHVLDAWGSAQLQSRFVRTNKRRHAPARLPGLGGGARHRRGGDACQDRRCRGGDGLHAAAGLRDRRLQGRAGHTAPLGSPAAPTHPAGAAQDAGVRGARARLPQSRQPARHARFRQARDRLPFRRRRQVLKALCSSFRGAAGCRFALPGSNTRSETPSPLAGEGARRADEGSGHVAGSPCRGGFHFPKIERPLIRRFAPPSPARGEGHSPRMTALKLMAIGLGLTAAVPARAYTAYVTNEKDNTVSVIDTDTWKVTKTVDVGRRPRGIVMNPDGKELYVCASDDDIIQVFDAKTMQQLRTLPSGPDPETFTISPDGKTLYVSNEDDNMVTMIDIAANKQITQVPVGVEPEGEGISPDGKTLVNTSETTNMASFIDTAQQKIVANVLVDSRPRIAMFSPSGDRLWVSSEVGGTVAVIDVTTHQIVHKVDFAIPGVNKDAIQPVGIRITKDGKTAYIALGPANHVAVVDTATFKVEKYLLVGQRVWQMAFTPDQKYLLTTNGVTNDVSVIEVADQKVTRSVPVGAYPWGVAVSPN